METPARAWVSNAEELRAELANRGQGFVKEVKNQLRKRGSEHIDARVGALGPQVEAAVDCTRCAACCKVLEPELSHEDVQRLAEIQSQSAAEFTQLSTETSNSGKVFLKASPCRFLKAGSCSIYASRPESCADFPHLYRPYFLFRRLIWEHYSLCPIVFNLVELLRDESTADPNSPSDIGEGLCST